MKILNYKERDTEEAYSKSFYLDFGIQVDHFVDFVKQFEINNNANLFECYCNSFSSDGSPLFTICFNKERLLKLKDWPNPFITFYATFNDKITGEYKFNLSTSTNSEVITYIVDKKKVK